MYEHVSRQRDFTSLERVAAQGGPRGRREAEFYEMVAAQLAAERLEQTSPADSELVANGTAADNPLSNNESSASDAGVPPRLSDGEQASVSGRGAEAGSGEDQAGRASLPFSVRNRALLRAVPRFCKSSASLR